MGSRFDSRQATRAMDPRTGNNRSSRFGEPAPADHGKSGSRQESQPSFRDGKSLREILTSPLGRCEGIKKTRPGQLVRTRIWPRRANSPDAHRISYGALPPLPSSVRVVRTPLEYDKPWYSKKNSHQRQERSRIALTAENRSHARFRTPDNCLIRFGVPCGKVPLKNSPDLRYLRSHLCLLNPSPSLSEKTI